MQSLVSISSEKKGAVGVVGHVGVGHVHSVNGYTQDDSAGFAVAASLVNLALNTDTRIRSVLADPSQGSIIVETYGGGIGKAFARRGITPMEGELVQKAVGEDGILTQAVAFKVFGRLYGQGVLEAACAFQTAVAFSVLDTLIKKAPKAFHVADTSVPGKLDRFAGIVIDIDNIPISVLLVINATEGGIGPDEDYEGNTMLDEKGDIMRSIGLDTAPTIIVESKAYIPAISPELDANHFFIRAQAEIDSTKAANAMVKACEDLKYIFRFSDTAMPMVKGQLKTATCDFADKLIALSNELKDVETSLDKVRIIAELAKLISQDAGGISFMSNGLNETVRGAGVTPGGISCVLSMIVTKPYCDYWKIPMLDGDDIDRYMKIILGAVPDIAKA